MLREEDLAESTIEEKKKKKADLKTVWAKVKTTYEKVCALNADESKDIHAKFVQLQRTNIRCINLLAKAKKGLPWKMYPQLNLFHLRKAVCTCSHVRLAFSMGIIPHGPPLGTSSQQFI